MMRLAVAGPSEREAIYQARHTVYASHTETVTRSEQVPFFPQHYGNRRRALLGGGTLDSGGLGVPCLLALASHTATLA